MIWIWAGKYKLSRVKDTQGKTNKNCEYFFSYPSFLSFVMGAQKNRLIETALLSTRNIVLKRTHLIEMVLFKYPQQSAQKNPLIEMVLLSTHNICFG